MPILGSTGGMNADAFGMFGTKGPGAVPHTLSVEAVSSSQLTLSWINGDPACNTQIFRNGVATPLDEVLPGISEYNDSGLPSANTNEYVVRHTRFGLNSANTDAKSNTTLLSSPSNLNVTTLSPSSINVSWTLGDSTANTQVFQGGTLVHNALPTATFYQASGLDSATSYTYRIRHKKNAVETANVGPVSNTTTLAAPTGLQVTGITTSSVTIAWVNSDTSVGTTTQIFKNDNSTEIGTVSAGVPNYTDNTLSPGESVTYKVRHIKNAIPSSNTASVPATTIVSAPTGLTATVLADNEVRLNWTNTNGSANTQIFLSGVGTPVANLNAGVTEYIHTGLTPATTYNWVIRHRLSGVPSANTGPASARPTALFGGGTEYTNGGYRIHAFIGSTQLTCTRPGTVEYVIVAGGGGGGFGYGGGGGGGGYQAGSSFINSTRNVDIGAGGPNNTNGSNSSLQSVATATGGGKGGSYTVQGSNGGSGGGGGCASFGNPPGGLSGGTGSQNFNGGSGYEKVESTCPNPDDPYGTNPANVGCMLRAGGGGGGATENGENGVITGDNPDGGDGGEGQTNSWTGISYVVGSGGGGSASSGNKGFGGTNAGDGGLGGSISFTNGVPNLGGGGGGGGGGSFVGGQGGSGVVLVRYLI